MIQKGSVLAITSASFIGIATIVGVQASKATGPFVLACLALLISSALIPVLALITKERLQIRKTITKHSNELIKLIVSRSIIGNVLLFTGFSMTVSIVAVFILCLEPMFVVLISRLFSKERIRLKQLGLIVFLLFGAFLISTGGHIGLTSSIGDLLIACALVFFAYSYIPSAKIMSDVPATSVMTLSNLLGGLVLIPVAIIAGGNFELALPNINLVVAYSVLFSLFALYFFFSALKTTKSWIVSSLLQLAPISGAVFAFFWLGEILGIVQIVGAFFIIISSYMIAREH